MSVWKRIRNRLIAPATPERSKEHAERMRVLGEISAGIAHEVSNPLTVILGRASLLRELIQSGQLTPEQLNHSLEQIEQTAYHIQRVIQGMKSMSRNSQADPLVRVNIRELIELSSTLARSKLLRHDIELKIDPGANAYEIACRPAQITQVLLNLILNAVDAIQTITGSESARRDQAWISISVGQNGSMLEIQVANGGPPIAPTIRQQIMDPYFTTKTQGNGTGLGLAISRSICEAHEGQLELKESNLTCFVVRLPLPQQKTQEAA